MLIPLQRILEKKNTKDPDPCIFNPCASTYERNPDLISQRTKKSEVKAYDKFLSELKANCLDYSGIKHAHAMSRILKNNHKTGNISRLKGEWEKYVYVRLKKYSFIFFSEFLAVKSNYL